MSDQGRHCPFLNRSDPRCSGHCSLDQLDYAFDYCFDQYKACPVYLERLAERRVRRLTGGFIRLAHTGPNDGADLWASGAESQGSHASTHLTPLTPLTQLTIRNQAHRYAQPAA